PCPFTSTPPTEFYTLSLHDALPISVVPDRAAEIELLPGVCASQPGGHFPGSAVVHWTAPDGEGVLFTGDTIGSVADPRWVTFMRDRKSTRLNSSHVSISYAVFCLKK